jgi:peptidoglycan/xylan/chitin deacetylase (PgdA/CDA1 family)
MGPYFIKTPWWAKKIFPRYVWNIPVTDKIVYLSFDDGPNPGTTNFILDELKKAGALASFFCIGKNVIAYRDLYQRILDEGHTVGNHTQNHLNGWKVSNETYLKDISEAANYIDSNLFRPPYGKIRSFQAANLDAAMKGRHSLVVMWDILSADFDPAIAAEEVVENVVFKSRPGSIIVFHDSEKSSSKIRYALPKVLDFFSAQGFKMESLEILKKKTGK